MTVLFTADSHYGHVNILEYCNRPFANVHEMDETLIANHNELVKPRDVVYNLGDFGLADPEHLESILNRLNGRIRFIQGNHDGWMSKLGQDGLNLAHRFGRLRNVEWIKRYHELEGPRLMAGKRKVKICLFHFAIGSWHCVHRGSWMLHGHSHGQYKCSWPISFKHGKIVDVGVDSWDYSPVSMDQLADLMSTLGTENPDDFTQNGKRYDE